MFHHEAFIRKSLELAKSAVEKGNHPFGVLLVQNGAVLLVAENTVNTDNDSTCHAELNLVRQASQRFGYETLSDSVLYTSTEPCVMCSGAIYWAGISTVVYACSAISLAKISGGGLLLPCREIFARGKRSVEVIGPILEEESIEIHKAFWL